MSGHWLFATPIKPDRDHRLSKCAKLIVRYLSAARVLGGSYYLWRGKYGGMNVSDAKRLKALEAENARLKKLLAEAMLEQEATREVLRKKW